MNAATLDELDIDYHCKQCAAFINGTNAETAAYFNNRALESHSLVVQQAINEAQTSAVLIAQRLSEQARYYLLYGVARRLGMIQVSYCDILGCIGTDRTEPLASDEVAAVERDLNVIYINIRGVLDNYAWCLLHQITTEKTRELANKHPIKVGLFSDKFMKDANLVSLNLSHFATWHTDLKDRRDPAAHRIPLYMPPAVLNSEEQERYAALETQIATATSGQNSDHLIEQQRKIGTFMPRFVHHPEEGQIALYPTIPQDIANLLKVARLVHVFLSDASSSNFP